MGIGIGIGIGVGIGVGVVVGALSSVKDPAVAVAVSQGEASQGLVQVSIQTQKGRVDG